ncbi:ABC transporter permease [Candidatus Bipolaricaulota bacterium]|nr:ABC transporter permease [Candidatus Bipolaricaulota bacterium]
MKPPRTLPRRANRSVSFSIGLVIVLFVLLVTIVGAFYTPYDPIKMHIADRLAPPTLQHPLGTDSYGRDVASRIMQGAGNTILVGVVAVSGGMALGILFGLIAGLAGGMRGEAMMRVMDVLYAFPAVLSAILFSSIFGASLTNCMIAIGIYNVPIFARLTRGSVLAAREEEYVAAAVAIGRSRAAVAWYHVLPNIISPLIVQGTIQFAGAILAEAGLSYLGLGIQPPFASWGGMLREAQTFMGLDPLLAVFPGIAIAITVLGLNLLGDGLRDMLDPSFVRSY